MKVGKIISSVLVALALTLLVTACPTRASAGWSEWTIMVYMAADNNLDPAGLDDISEMQVVGSKDGINIVVLFDRWAEACGTNGSVLLYIEKDESKIIWGGWSDEYELNMGDPETLKWFINYTIEQYSAENYALVLWDHGYNWEGVCWDWTNDDYLTIEEVKTAISESKIERIDLLGFDACLMSSIEVAYTMSLTGKVGMMVASEEYVPWDGWPYDLILSGLTENLEWSAKEFSIYIVDSYIASYSHGTQGFAWYATLSAIDLNNVDELVTQVADLTGAILADFKKYRSALTGAKSSADRYWFGFWHQGAYIDLYQFIYMLGTINKKLTFYTAPILENWKNVVIYAKACNGPHIKGANGLTIYFPRNRNLFYTPEPYYESVPEFATATQWYKLLTTYFNK